MGKIIKFRKAENKEKVKEEIKEETKSIYLSEDTIDRVRKGVEDYILYNFAVKEILGMDVVYKENDKREIGVIGVIAYEHKRRPGTFVADFIGKGHIDKDGNVIIDILAFRAGEPELYSSTEKVLKAKKILPEIKEIE